MKKEYSDTDFEMFVMPFGKYRNWTLEELPPHYILWMLDQDFCPPVLKAYGELHEEELIEKNDSESIGYEF